MSKPALTEVPDSELPPTSERNERFHFRTDKNNRVYAFSEESMARGVVYVSRTKRMLGSDVVENSLAYPALERLAMIAKSPQEFIWRVNQQS